MNGLLKTSVLSAVTVAAIAFNAKTAIAEPQNLFEGFDDLSNWTNPSGYDLEQLFVDDPFSSGQSLSWLNLIDSPSDVDFGVNLAAGRYTVSFDILAPANTLPSGELNKYFRRNFGTPTTPEYDLNPLATGFWENVAFEISLPEERDKTLRGYFNDFQDHPTFATLQDNLDLLKQNPTYTGITDFLLGNFVVEAVTEPEPDTESVIDVLWYGQTPTYNQHISNLASAASNYDPWGDGALDWNLTFWNPDDPTPDFSQYDTLVIGNAFSSNFNVSRLLNSKEEIEAARGSRTFLSGQDADLHYIRNLGSRPDGPFGFLVNAVNWAGSGTDLGIVSLPDGHRGTGSRWWLHENSFLKDELEGNLSYFTEEWVVIPTETSDFPVNEGLTTAGLSNWQQSSHLGFNKDIPGYLSINDAGSYPGWAVTIVTASEASGGTGGSQKVPEPTTTIALFGFGSIALKFLRKRKS